MEWLGVLSIGTLMFDTNGILDCDWKKGEDIIYPLGYMCKRQIYDSSKNKRYIVHNCIVKSIHSKPLFQSKVFHNDDEIYDVIAPNPTTAFRNVLNYLEVNMKGKLNGCRYFGFFTNDYRSNLSTLKNSITVQENLEDLGVPIDPNVGRYSRGSSVHVHTLLVVSIVILEFSPGHNQNFNVVN